MWIFLNENYDRSTLSRALMEVDQIVTVDHREGGRARIRLKQVRHSHWARNLRVVGKEKISGMKISNSWMHHF